MSRRVLWIAGVASLVACGILAYHLDAAWRTRADAIRRRDIAEAHLRSMQSTRTRERVRLTDARRAQQVATTAHDRAGLIVEQRNAELVGTRAEAADAESLRDVKNAEVGVVRECLAGAGAALDAEARHDTAATIAALRLVDGPCRAAAAGSSGPAPRYGFDFPDPFVLTVGTAHYAFATNATAGNIQMLQEQADGSWSTVGDALGRFPDWAGWGRTWAPAVLARPGGYVMYYTVREAITGRQCISRAVSPDPGGPYLDASTAPLVCGEREALDPEPVVAADGSAALLWKRERPATIVAAPLTPDGLALAGFEHELLRATRSWQATNVEAPSMLVGPGGVWLFYSANSWNGRNYATGVVHCTSVLGPCDSSAPGPLLRSHDSVMGPGGGSVFQDAPGRYRLAYHAYQAPNVGYPASRLLFIATIDLRSGRPVIVE